MFKAIHFLLQDSRVRENGVLKVKKRKLDEGEMLRRRKKMIDKFNAKKQKQRSDTSENEMDSKATDAQPGIKICEVTTRFWAYQGGLVAMR